MEIQIRQGKPAEATTLTAIAHAAKRHWGYPEEWIQKWQTDLTITPDFITDNQVFVAIVSDEIVGCCALVVGDSSAEIEHMWIKPEYMGSGVGRALFIHVRDRATELHLPALELSAAPNAEGFYERMGAARIGEVRADMGGRARFLPRMKVDLIQARPPNPNQSSKPKVQRPN